MRLALFELEICRSVGRQLFSTRSIGLLEHQPANFRRVILLLSQAVDDGGRTTAEELLRRLGESNTTTYSLSFSRGTKAALANDFANSYVLSFQPSSDQPGFHWVRVQVVARLKRVTVDARAVYWRGDAAAADR